MPPRTNSPGYGFITRSSCTVAPADLATIPAYGMTCAARADPSSGTKTREYIRTLPCLSQ